MIYYIKGKIEEKTPSFVVIDCGGVGYFIKISLYTYNQIQDKQEAKILTHFQIKEDSQTLFGFYEKKEKDLFELLISVSGVGGNTALVMLSALPPEELSNAIHKQQTAVLKGIKGIGAKISERIVLELKDRVERGVGEGVIEKAQENPLKKDAITALVNMGFSKAVIEPKLNAMLKENQAITLSELIKLAMKN